MSELFSLPDIHFADRNAAVIKRNIIAGFESAFFEAAGERLTLYPGDPRQLFLSAIADVIVLQRNIIDYTGRQNMLAYSSGDYLEHLGLLLGVTRLPPQRAKTTVRISLSAMMPGTTVIPEGIRVTTGDGNIYFASSQPLEIPPGELAGDVQASALEPGVYANGLLPGQINRLVDPLPYVQGVTNTTASEGGADTEDDENLRERIHLAPESFSNAGSKGAYIFWARSASQLIDDVEVHSPSPGVVDIYPLLKGGVLPEQEILDLVLEVCSADTVRPMTDLVRVLAPEEVGFDLDVTWFLERGDAAMSASITNAVTKAVDDWTLWQRSKLGRDINDSELITRIRQAGAKRAAVTSPDFTALAFNQIGVVSSSNVVYGGVENG
ncbi:MAG: baseplate J/gp47 family protein [Synergistaceae bacterium]|jgi:phage-related baseplate assembly protein|nr:baseplate J/gp47 family protein [Synergistaceae bacterium]